MPGVYKQYRLTQEEGAREERRRLILCDVRQKEGEGKKGRKNEKGRCASSSVDGWMVNHTSRLLSSYGDDDDGNVAQRGTRRLERLLCRGFYLFLFLFRKAATKTCKGELNAD